MKRVYVTAVMLLAAMSCQKNISTTTKDNVNVKVFLTDDQSLIFDAVNIDIAALEVKTEDSVSGQSDDHGNDDHGSDDGTDDHRHGGWTSLNVQPGVYNLLNLRNGLDTMLATGTIPSGRIQKIRLTLGSNNTVVLNGQQFPLTVKDKDNQVVINLGDDAFTSSNNNLQFWLDFDAGRSVRQRGNGFELRSSIRAFRKEKAGSVEGRVLPIAAKPILYLINGTDTSSGKPEAEGEFKFVGLKAGSYTLWVDATAGAYKDTLLRNIVVRDSEDTHIGTINLHQ